MGLRARRRNLVVWNSCAGPAETFGAARPARPARTRRVRGFVRIGALLLVLGLMRLARAVRPRWKPLLAGVALTVAGFMLRGGAWGAVLLPGLLLLLSAPLIPAGPDADPELARELAAYSTPAQRRDLEATLDRYPDSVTYQLREILASQALAAGNGGIPGSGRG